MLPMASLGSQRPRTITPDMGRVFAILITLRRTQGIQLSLQRSAGHPRLANLQRLG